MFRQPSASSEANITRFYLNEGLTWNKFFGDASEIDNLVANFMFQFMWQTASKSMRSLK